MASTFNVNKADGYEQLMGRWSRRLAIPFIEFAGPLAKGEKVIDVGCGTGSLTFALAEDAALTEIVAVDLSPVFVKEAQKRNSDPRIQIQQADACALPFEAGQFDRAYSLLVLHFVPEPGKAVSEMRRVVRSGGTIAAAVWDHLGGLPSMRMMWDTVAAMNGNAWEARNRYFWQPMMQPGEMKACFQEQGLVEVEERSLLIRMDYGFFDDYWAPIASGEGPIGKFVATLEEAERIAAQAAVKAAYEAGRPDGARSFAAVAWACRGTVP